MRAGTVPPELWAQSDDVQQCLAYMLVMTQADHRASVQADLNGSLTEAHAVGLYRLIDDAKLQAPPVVITNATTTFSVNLKNTFRVIADKRTGRFHLDVLNATRALERGDAGAQARLDAIRSKLFDANMVRLRVPNAASGGGGDGSPNKMEWEQQSTSLYAIAMGTHERLGMGYASRDEPCAVRLVADSQDLLRLIAAHVRGTVNPILVPPRREVLVLREKLRLSQVSTQHYRTLAEQLAVDAAAATTVAERAVRRELNASFVATQLHDRLMTEQTEEHAMILAKERAKHKEDMVSYASRMSEQRAQDREVINRLQERTEEAKASKTDAVRETVQELREYQQRMAVERDEAAQRATELDARVSVLSSSLQRVRSSSKSGLMDQVAELQSKVRELNTRRQANQMTVKEANLYKQQAKQSTEAAVKQRSRLNEFWASEKETARELEKVKAEATALSIENYKLQAEVKRQLEESTKLKAIAEPGKERFKAGNHFSAEVDLSIVQVLTLGIAPKKVPKLYAIFARLFGIKLPGREIKVPGPVVDGVRTYIKRFVFHTPGATHSKEMAGVMYQINKLQARLL